MINFEFDETMNGESIETSESNSIQTHQNLNGNGKVKGKGKGTGKAIENTNNTHQSTSHRSHRSHHSNHRSSYLSSFQRRHQQQSRRHRFPDNSLRFPSDHQTGEDPIQSYIPHHHHHDDDDEEDEDNLSNSSFTDQSHDSDYSPQSSMLAYSSEPEDGLLRLRIHESRQQHLLRHGFNEAYNSDEYLEGLAKTYFMYWDDTPYKTTKPSDLKQIPFWRPPVKHRTVCAALFLCLRLGFDPPDVVKTSPAPKLEAWVDPKMYPKESVLETIAKRLQDQFESLAPPHARVKFKTYPDVYSEEFKKTLIGLRKYSKNDRCLVYYNGHGVPKPTQTGELWVFNKAYTQYIPISIADILSWAGPPSVFIWDCNNAGHIVNAIIQASATKDEEIAAELELRRLQGSSGVSSSNEWPSVAPMTSSTNLAEPPSGSGRTSPSVGKSQIPQFLLQNPAIRYSDTIQLAACQADQMLPRDPEAPADIFTACLSSPIEMALRFYVLRNNARDANWTSTAEFFNDLGKIDKVPGRMEMRRTPLGELTWIFTSIADAIAWNHLDRHLFTRIFRGDLVLAALFRGFLLAERVMRAYGCTPISMPKLPPTHQSELWKCWDLEVDMCLSQLPAIWRSEAIRAEYDSGKKPRVANSIPPKVIPYRTSTFFSQQLTAFELWLKEIVAHNPDENGEKDEEMIMKQKTMLRWSCNDWPSVKMDRIEVTDFATAHPPAASTPLATSTSAAGLAGKHKPSMAPHTQSTPAFTNGTHAFQPSQENTRPRPIRYRLPTYIKHFPINSRPGDDLYPPSPPQLPIVLQVLLSQLHRLRALILLCRFMDLGPWAVHLSLSIGIFQYVLKLLQAPAAELRPVLIFIWARILTVYPEGRMELFRPGPGRPHAGPDAAPVEYFVRLLAPHTPELLPVANVVDHKAMCAFILSIGCKNLPTHANRLLNLGVLEILVHRLPELVASQRQWYLILLAHLWEQSGAAKGRAIRMGVHTVVSELLTDTVPEVRTAAMYAFGTLLGVSTDPNGIGEIEDELSGTGEGLSGEIRKQIPPNEFQSNKLYSLSSCNPLVSRIGYEEQVSIEVNSAMVCCHSSNDGSPMLRKELVIVLSALVDQHLGEFIVAAFLAGQSNEEAKVMKTSDLIKKYRNEEDARKYGNGFENNEEVIEDYLSQQPLTDRSIKLEKLLNQLESNERETSMNGNESIKPYLWLQYSSIYQILLDLTLDPVEEVSEAAIIVVDYIHSRLTSSVLGLRLGLDELIEEQEEDEDEEHRDRRRTWSNRQEDHHHHHGNETSSSRRPTGGGGVFPSLSTVNQLVPNFVKNTGWKTPFARSPETTEDGPSRLQNRLRNVGVNVGTDRKSEEETRANPRSSSNPSSIDTPISLLWERRSKLGSSEVPLETIIARTRLSDDERRQRQRVYPLLTRSVNTHQESTFDYLIYLGLHDSEELKVEGNQRKRNLPLRSSYYNLSCFVFLKPRMADKEVGMVGEESFDSGEGGEDHLMNEEKVGNHSGHHAGGLAQIKALWRKNRNEKIILESQPLKADAARLPWDRIVNEWKTESVVSQVVMHQFEDQIITSDIDGYLTVYDTENKIKLNRFKNSDDRRGGSRITSVKLVNEDDVALVLTGTADGNVRIFRNYERKPELVTGFKSLPNSEPSKVGSSGLILDWQQSSGLLLCGGDSREIKVWNSKKEMCIENIKTRSGSPLTSLSSDHVSSFIICAGFGDGSIRVYDRRESLKSSMVRVYKAIHRSWVHTLHMQRGGQRELVSGDSCGDVVQWDVRLDQPLRFFRAHDDGMPALDIHEHAPVFATGSIDGKVKLWDISSELFGVPLKSFYSTPHHSLNRSSLSNTIGRKIQSSSSISSTIKSVTSLGFHPHKMMLSVGRANNRLEVIQCREIVRVLDDEIGDDQIGLIGSENYF